MRFLDHATAGINTRIKALIKARGKTRARVKVQVRVKAGAVGSRVPRPATARWASRILSMTLLAGVAAVPTSTPLSPSAAAPAPDCAMAVAPRLLSSDCEAFVADAAALQASGDDIDLVLRLMDAVKSPLDAAARRRVAGEVVATGLTIPSGDRRPWYVLLAVESKFDQRARSAAGAVGVGQIVPIDLNYFERVTGVRATRQSLAKSLRVNLAVSARFYSYLASRTRSRVLALVAYNAGANSGEVRNLSNVTAINLETANYVAKHAFLMDATGEGRELLAMAP